MFAIKQNQKYYQIENVNELPAFFMNIATASDMWAYLSSNGAMTAGRGSSSNSIFPYETDDRLHLATSTGPKTIVRQADGQIWEPFTVGFDSPFTISRNLYKRNTGDAVLFEEVNEDLQLCFSYRWETSEQYGLVRTAEITNLSSELQTFEILDGVENIMPHGIHPQLAQGSSCLTDAYKACEKHGDRLAIYSLTSTIGDTPEPIEILQANVAWQAGNAKTLLSSKQVMDFARGLPLENETRAVGRKGAFFTHQQLQLASGASQSWIIVMDAGLNQKAVAELANKINNMATADLLALVAEDIKKGTDELVRIVASADGLQQTANETTTARHYLSVLYNNMRGGVFLDGYAIDPKLFTDFVKTHNHGLVQRQKAFFEALGDVDNILQLHEKARQNGDADLIRLSLEFLPLTFSRRHGDPSRPWNQFNIRVKDDKGGRIYAYEGNWRDIFQNWEAMSRSFPAYIGPMIVKFLNASTADGFNPYRINQDGIDWETPLPHDPFAGYGYWGDHQIVYLNKLLEWLNAYSPQAVQKLITAEIFTYANVPYEIKPYETFLKDSKNTIYFNQQKHDAIKELVAKFGTDGKLMMKDNELYLVSFVEKLLVPILAKLSNLVPAGGIWMNTHRPEWNDANNAIVGNGLSMVTVYQLYRHLNFCQDLLKELAGTTVTISVAVKKWFSKIAGIIEKSHNLTPRAFLDQAGMAFNTYRQTIYTQGFSNKETLNFSQIQDFFKNSLELLGQTIDANRRPDGMYHSYNILTLASDTLKIEPLFLMLEGQSAVLGSGRLSKKAALELVRAMESSALMNSELGQFFLYPQKSLATFMERNLIPRERAKASQLITELLEANHEGLVFQDVAGNIRFHHEIKQSADVDNWLEILKASDAEASLVRELYEAVFSHKQFTGRSGIMYKYEGIGCIFWHQNAKQLLSLQEVLVAAVEENNVLALELKQAYYRLRAGFGFTKTAKQWGAFPLEPYSHTPYQMPAQQPGMTGQAKEDVLLRWTELGALVADGVLAFSPALLQLEEFVADASTFSYLNQAGEVAEVALPENSLAFTVCRIPVVYHLSTATSLKLYSQSNTVLFSDNALKLDQAWSSAVFNGDERVGRIEVSFSEDLIVK